MTEHLLCFICSDARVIHYYIKWLLLLFLVIFSACLSGSDGFVLFDSLNENVSQMFYAILQFCSQVKFESLDGNVAAVVRSEMLFWIRWL